MRNISRVITISSAACLIACAGEFVTIFVFGARYPGYSQLKNTMSSLGASASPVSAEISLWWIIMGVLFIIFGTGLRLAFSAKGWYARSASWLVILYGIGEGIGSGAFKADHILNAPTTSAFIHNVLGGIGVTAILIFPLVIRKVITRNETPFFQTFSWVIFVTGILTIIAFLFRFSSGQDNFLSLYKGLWQRLFMLNTYIYLSVIAILMLKKRQHFHRMNFFG